MGPEKVSVIFAIYNFQNINFDKYKDDSNFESHLKDRNYSCENKGGKLNHCETVEINFYLGFIISLESLPFTLGSFSFIINRISL